MTRRTRLALLAAGAAAVTVGATGVAGMVRDGGGTGTPAVAATAPVHTATVERRDLVNRERVDGTLGYAPMGRQVANGRTGTLTAIAGEGAVVERGHALYAVDGRPVVLLFGDAPLFRELTAGSVGSDVRQLEENLVALGKATRAQVGVDDTFTAATAAAVKRWQGSLGVEETGTLRPGDAVFLPGAARVSAHRAVVGARLPDGAEVVDVTTTTRVVTVQLAASKQGRVHVGDEVVVELPSGATTPGKVASIARTAKTDSSGNGSAKTIVEVTVSLDDPAATGEVDKAPVKVGITTSRADGVLAVPVTALVAVSEGGYAVEVVRRGGQRQLVPVETGMFSDSADLVEVTGELHPGDVVVTSE